MILNKLQTLSGFLAGEISVTLNQSKNWLDDWAPSNYCSHQLPIHHSQ